MAFPAEGGTTFPIGVEEAWKLARQTARGIKNEAVRYLNEVSSGPVSAKRILDIMASLSAYSAQLTTVAGVPGVATYAQEQVNNPSLNIVNEFGAMQTALGNAITWATTNFPKDASGNLLGLKLEGTTPVWGTFTQAQLSSFSSLMSTLSATIA